MPDKHEVGGSSPLGPTKTLTGNSREVDEVRLYIENRIEEKNKSRRQKRKSIKRLVFLKVEK